MANQLPDAGAYGVPATSTSASTSPSTSTSGTPLPGAGVYGAAQAQAQAAYQQALAQLAQQRGDFLSSSGLMLGADGQLAADPNATYGGYQQMLANQGFDQRAAELNYNQSVGNYQAQLADIQGQAAMVAADAQARAAEARGDAQFRIAGAEGDYRSRMRDFLNQETQGTRDHDFSIEDLEHMLATGTTRLGEDFGFTSDDLLHSLETAKRDLGLEKTRALRDSGLTEDGQYDLANDTGAARRLMRAASGAMDEADAAGLARGLGAGGGLGAQGASKVQADMGYDLADLRNQLVDALTNNANMASDAQYGYDRGMQSATRARDRGLEDVNYEHDTGVRRADTRLQDLMTAIAGGREDAGRTKSETIEAANRAASSAASAASRSASAAQSSAARQASAIQRAMTNLQGDYALSQERAQYGSGAELANFLSGAGRAWSGFNTAEMGAYNDLQNSNNNALLAALAQAVLGQGGS